MPSLILGNDNVIPSDNLLIVHLNRIYKVTDCEGMQLANFFSYEFNSYTFPRSVKCTVAKGF